MSYITAIGTAVPQHKFEQSTISRFMQLMMARSNHDAERKIKAVFRASGIHERHSVLEDYGKTADFRFYPNDDSEFPGTEARMKVYRDEALPLSVRAVNDMVGGDMERIKGVTHLIVVTCTGMYAPGLDIDLVKALHLQRSVQRTCVQFMGCYAAFNAMKVADAICKSAPRQEVLVVCTELCSIHFQQSPTDDNILANALFSDGAAAMLISSQRSEGAALEILSSFSDLALQGEKDMAWNVGDYGFQMQLSSYVPDLIKNEIGPLIERFLSSQKIDSTDIAHYAMHPGGTKILQVIEECLGLSKDQNAHAYNVLRNFGNMSSATVVFVLKGILSDLVSDENGKLVLSMGFGPGLTLESMIYKIHTQ